MCNSYWRGIILSNVSIKKWRQHARVLAICHVLSPYMFHFSTYTTIWGVVTRLSLHPREASFGVPEFSSVLNGKANCTKSQKTVGDAWDTKMRRSAVPAHSVTYATDVKICRSDPKMWRKLTGYVFFAQDAWSECTIPRLYWQSAWFPKFLTEFRWNFLFGVYTETCTVKLIVVWIAIIYVKTSFKRGWNRNKRNPSTALQRAKKSTKWKTPN
jgi:hypothetical protein